MSNLSKYYILIYRKAKDKKYTNIVLYLVNLFFTIYGLVIVKLIHVYFEFDQISKYIVESESQMNHRLKKVAKRNVGKNRKNLLSLGCNLRYLYKLMVFN